MKEFGLMNLEMVISLIILITEMNKETKSDKFCKEIEKFVELDWIYKYHLIYGLTNAWQEKKKFEWGKVFDFLLKVLDCII